MMSRAHRNGRIRFLAAALFLFSAAVSLYAGGARDDNSLSRADELIAAKEFNEAIRLLTDYVQDNPDEFAEAQERLQQIVRIRDRYNAVANELLDILEREPENSERIFALSEELQSIESPSNPETRRFLEMVRYLAELNVNRNRLERILAAAREQLNGNNFSLALNTYASGLDIYRDLFFSSGYGQEAEDTAALGLDTIQDNIGNFNGLITPLGRISAAIINLDRPVLPPPEELASLYAEFSPLLDELAALKRSFVETRQAFDAQLAVLQARDSTLGDRSFLSFAGWLLTGPVGQNEGMAGTMDRFWRFRVGSADAALSKLVDRSYAEAYRAMENGDYAEAPERFDRSAGYIAQALALAEDWNSFFRIDGGESYSFFGEIISAGESRAYLKFRALDSAVGRLRNALDIAARGETLGSDDSPALSSWREGAMETSEAIALERGIRGQYQELRGELDTLEGALEAEIAVFADYEGMIVPPAVSPGETPAENPAGASVPPSQTYLARVGDIYENLEGRFLAEERNSAVRQYTIANGDLESRVNAREAEFNEGNALIAGVRREVEGADVYTAYYPSEGAAVLTRMSGSLAADIETAEALVSGYAAEPRIMLDAPELSALYADARDLRDRLLAFRNQSAATLANTRPLIQRAASLRFEGDRLYQAARTALGRNDLTGARNNLARATEQYNASLAIQDSDSLRESWNDQLLVLGADIVRIENEIVVRDVRNLVTTARGRYYDGNMDQAEELLVRAQNRWRVTNITEHTDVEYWLRLVRGALSIHSGRTIAATAPLYAEMSQLLSEAKRNYDEGTRLLSVNRRAEGLARFGEASEKTREIRLIFPMNQEARLIELRIEQQTDTAAFNANFRTRLNEAVAGTRRGNAESYADLQDLAGINPRYPGMQALLSQAEIDMGLRPPPPDPADLARSAELTQNAQGVINTRDNLRYEAAQIWLREAVTLNPNNTQAQTLMDQLNIFMTGTGTIILPPFAMDQYNNALQEYLRGNFLTANAIVERLLQNSEYRKSIQIQDLKRRIDAVL